MSENSDLVTFNVSGKIYQVLREPTLSLHPNSLLTQLAEDQKDDKPIFVEGDQELFKFVLDYHRDRKVIVPIAVAKDAVLRELRRFGLDPSKEQPLCLAFQIVEDGICLTSIRKRLNDWSEQNQLKRQKLSAEIAGSFLADAAAEKALPEDYGGGFSVGHRDLYELYGLGVNTKIPEVDEIFGDLDVSLLEESESLKDFARSFGYSMTLRKTGDQRFLNNNVQVDFKPAF